MEMETNYVVLANRCYELGMKIVAQQIEIVQLREQLEAIKSQPKARRYLINLSTSAERVTFDIDDITFPPCNVRIKSGIETDRQEAISEINRVIGEWEVECRGTK